MRNDLTKALIIVSVLALLVLTVRFGPLMIVWTTMILVLSRVLYLRLRRYVKHMRDLKWHGARKEPIVILAKYDGDDTLLEQFKHHVKYLELSNNMNHIKSIDNKGREVRGPVPVEVIYQNFPAENYGETWEEYVTRASEKRLKILREFHSYLYNDGRHEWYLNQILNQKI